MSVFILKKYDKELIKFEMHKNFYDEMIVEVLWKSKDVFDYPERVDGSAKSIISWLKNRMIPRNRAFVKEILMSQRLNENDLEESLKICMALSVNDIYWVVEEDFHGRFDDYNLYDNSFSEALSLVAFTGYSETLKELSPSPEMTTNGMLPKAWKRVQNTLYLYKGGTNAELYSNGGREPYSEYYAAQVAKAMGIIHVSYDLEIWKGILASVCENFTSKDISYVPIGHVLEEYSISCLVDKVKKLGFVKDFKHMILFDALILNEDRHFGNFGLLKNNATNKFVGFAPLFDHGISLFSYLKDEDIMNKKHFDEYKIAHSQSALGATHEKLVTWFCDHEDIKYLKKLYNFHFYKHPHYNLSDERLKILENYIHMRSIELSELILHGEKEVIKQDTDTDEQIIQGEFLGVRYQFTGNEEKGGLCILIGESLQLDRLMIHSDDLKLMDVVTFIENKIEEIQRKNDIDI